RAPEPFVQAARLEEGRAPHGGGAEDRTVVRDDARRLILDREGRDERVVRADDLAVQLERGVRRQHVEVRAGGGELGERLQAAGQVDVVRIQERDEIAR